MISAILDTEEDDEKLDDLLRALTYAIIKSAVYIHACEKAFVSISNL